MAENSWAILSTSASLAGITRSRMPLRADRSLPAYSLSDLSFGYRFKPRRVLKEIDFGLDFNNIFSARVAQSGWVYSAICDSYGHPNENRYYQIGFIPVAPLTIIGHVTLRF